MGWPASANACSCSELTPQYSSNTLTRSPSAPFVAIPEDAKGILFFSDVHVRDVEVVDTGKFRVESVAPALTAAKFCIVEAGTGGSVQPIFTRLNVDRKKC